MAPLNIWCQVGSHCPSREGNVSTLGSYLYTIFYCAEGTYLAQTSSKLSPHLPPCPGLELMLLPGTEAHVSTHPRRSIRLHYCAPAVSALLERRLLGSARDGLCLRSSCCVWIKTGRLDQVQSDHNRSSVCRQKSLITLI